MWKNLRRFLDMEKKIIPIDSNLLAWIRAKAEVAIDCQIIMTIEDGKIVRATCYMNDTFQERG